MCVMKQRLQARGFTGISTYISTDEDKGNNNNDEIGDQGSHEHKGDQGSCYVKIASLCASHCAADVCAVVDLAVRFSEMRGDTDKDTDIDTDISTNIDTNSKNPDIRNNRRTLDKTASRQKQVNFAMSEQDLLSACIEFRPRRKQAFDSLLASLNIRTADADAGMSKPIYLYPYLYLSISLSIHTSIYLITL